MNLKKQLKVYLDRHGMTVRQLSRKAGVPNATLAEWLAGTTPRHLEHLRRVASALDTTIDHLLYGDGLHKVDFDLTTVIDDRWVSGVFEIKMKRVRK